MATADSAYRPRPHSGGPLSTSLPWRFRAPLAGLGRALAVTFFPANPNFETCLQCPRVSARAQPDVPVSYPSTDGGRCWRISWSLPAYSRYSIALHGKRRREVLASSAGLSSERCQPEDEPPPRKRRGGSLGQARQPNPFCSICRHMSSCSVSGSPRICLSLIASIRPSIPAASSGLTCAPRLCTRGGVQFAALLVDPLPSSLIRDRHSPAQP
jgi:hypothetical protein